MPERFRFPPGVTTLPRLPRFVDGLWGAGYEVIPYVLRRSDHPEDNRFQLIVPADPSLNEVLPEGAMRRILVARWPRAGWVTDFHHSTGGRKALLNLIVVQFQQLARGRR